LDQKVNREEPKSSKEAEDCLGELPAGLLEPCVVPRHDTLNELRVRADEVIE
jgi:hypothetical protein